MAFGWVASGAGAWDVAAGAGRRLGLLHLPLLCGAPERKLPEGDGHARSPRGAEPALGGAGRGGLRAVRRLEGRVAELLQGLARAQIWPPLLPARLSTPGLPVS